MKFRIIEDDEYEGRIFLGTVVSPKGMSRERALKTINDNWSDFMETEPDTDSSYIAYLVEKFGFTEVDDDTEEVVVAAY